MKIGVIADTHIPELLPSLPSKVGDVFEGLDIILHGGDICGLDTLHELENSFTITMAVAGERDDPEAKRYLEDKKVLRFGNRSIGMIHGHREDGPSRWERIRRKLMGVPRHRGLPEYVRSQFEDVDCIVFGHSHRPYVKVVDGVLLFNPGAVAPTRGLRPSVGILEVGRKTITGRIVYLQ